MGERYHMMVFEGCFLLFAGSFNMLFILLVTSVGNCGFCSDFAVSEKANHSGKSYLLKRH